MVNTNKLKALIVENGLKTSDVASALGMSDKVWYDRIKKGKFDADEMYKLIKILHIENPTPVFFADEVTQ